MVAARPVADPAEEDEEVRPKTAVARTDVDRGLEPPDPRHLVAAGVLAVSRLMPLTSSRPHAAPASAASRGGRGTDRRGRPRPRARRGGSEDDHRQQQVRPDEPRVELVVTVMAPSGARAVPKNAHPATHSPALEAQVRSEASQVASVPRIANAETIRSENSIAGGSSPSGTGPRRQLGQCSQPRPVAGEPDGGRTHGSHEPGGEWREPRRDRQPAARREAHAFEDSSSSDGLGEAVTEGEQLMLGDRFSARRL